MKKCKCEHWQTCPVCYPRGFDRDGNRKPVEVPPTRDEMLSRVKELEAELLNKEGMTYGGNCGRDRIDAAMKVGAGDTAADDEEPEWQNAVQAAFGGIVQTPQG